MKTFNIFNSKDDEATIDILGEIGIDWWTGEGNTMSTVNDQIKALDVGTIIVNIGSLGGNADEGLGMYSMLRQHKARIITNIVSPTASAGTVVASAGDEVRISHAVNYLIHNTWTGVMGNAEDLKDVASDLEQFDDRLVDVYQKRTGLRKSKIRKLMAEDRWMSPKEAKELGFVDKIVEGNEVSNKVVQTIQASAMPNYIQNNKNMNAEVKKDFLEKIDEKFNALMAKIAGHKSEETLKAEIETAKQDAIDKVEAQAKVDEDAKIEAEVKTSLDDEKSDKETEDLKAELAQAKTDKEAADKIAEELTEENKRLAGGETVTESREDEEDSKNKLLGFWDIRAIEVNNKYNR